MISGGKRKALGPQGVRTSDSFRNFTARLGQGTGNQAEGNHYSFQPVTRNRIQCEMVYRGSWIGGRMVDVVAIDMTREGVIITSDDDPGDIAEFEQDVADMQVWTQLCDTVKWARLYGGSLAFMMIDGQDASTPLKLESLEKDQFKGLLPLDRWVIDPSMTELVEDYGPNFGKPKFYKTLPDAGGMPKLNIHYSRVIRIPGVKLPYWQSVSENLWEQSVIERVWDRLTAFDSATIGAAQLVYKAHLRVLTVEGMREMIGGNKDAQTALLAQVEMMRYTQSNEGISLIDGNDKLEALDYSFTGLDSILASFSEQIAGATDIPLVRLFGQSPKGFSTGDTDLRNYYDSIRQQQIAQLGPGVNTLYRILYINKYGIEPPPGWSLKFKPLWQMTDSEKSTVTSTLVGAIDSAFQSNMIDRTTAMKELKVVSQQTGIFTNITDEAIQEAEDDPPPDATMLGLEEPTPSPMMGGPPGAEGGEAPPEGDAGGLPPAPSSGGDAGGFSLTRDSWLERARGRVRGWLDSWEEGKHKRGQPKNAGQFGAGGGSAKAAPAVERRSGPKEAEPAFKMTLEGMTRQNNAAKKRMQEAERNPREPSAKANAQRADYTAAMSRTPPSYSAGGSSEGNYDPDKVKERGEVMHGTKPLSARERHAQGGGAKLPFVNEFMNAHPNKESALTALKAMKPEKLKQALTFLEGHSDDDSKYMAELIAEVKEEEANAARNTATGGGTKGAAPSASASSETAPSWSSAKKEDPLFHGTDENSYEHIVKEGFKPSHGGMYGNGVYMTDNPKKARDFGGKVVKARLKAGLRVKTFTKPEFEKYLYSYEVAKQAEKMFPNSPGTTVKQYDEAMQQLMKEQGYGAHKIKRDDEGQQGDYTVIYDPATLEIEKDE